MKTFSIIKSCSLDTRFRKHINEGIPKYMENGSAWMGTSCRFTLTHRRYPQVGRITTGHERFWPVQNNT